MPAPLPARQPPSDDDSDYTYVEEYPSDSESPERPKAAKPPPSKAALVPRQSDGKLLAAREAAVQAKATALEKEARRFERRQQQERHNFEVMKAEFHKRWNEAKEDLRGFEAAKADFFKQQLQLVQRAKSSSRSRSRRRHHRSHGHRRSSHHGHRGRSHGRRSSHTRRSHEHGRSHRSSHGHGHHSHNVVAARTSTSAVDASRSKGTDGKPRRHRGRRPQRAGEDNSVAVARLFDKYLSA